jgi:hypothetical protein
LAWGSHGCDNGHEHDHEHREPGRSGPTGDRRWAHGLGLSESARGRGSRHIAMDGHCRRVGQLPCPAQLVVGPARGHGTLGVPHHVHHLGLQLTPAKPCHGSAGSPEPCRDRRDQRPRGAGGGAGTRPASRRSMLSRSTQGSRKIQRPLSRSLPRM